MRASRRTLAVLFLAVVTLSGCTSASSSPSGTASSSDKAAAKPVKLAVNIPDKATDVTVDKVVAVTATHGTVKQATVKSTDGKSSIPGRVTDAGWQATERLEPGTAYQVDVDAVGDDGEPQKLVSGFTTQALTLQQQTYVQGAQPQPNEKVGIGMPIVINFDVPVVNKATFEKRMRVTANPSTEGSWHWFSDTEVHYRPKEYWKPGTKVSVRLGVNGLPAGNGIYGQKNYDFDFTVGRSAVTTVDVAAHKMVYRENGKAVRTINMSAGDASHQSREGTKIIMEKYDSVDMDAASTGVDADDPGYYNMKGVKWAMRLTNSGEFLHAAPWNAGYMGRANMSHGCTGMTTDDAYWLYSRTLRGDVFKYINSPRGLEDRNGWTDWNVSWDQWKDGSALKHDAPAASSTPTADQPA